MSDHLFLYHPKRDVEQLLDALFSCVGVPVRLLDEQGAALLAYGEPASCRLSPEGEDCEAEHFQAGLRAVDLGEPYIFRCRAGRYHISCPIVNRDTLFGAVLLGPFLIDGADEPEDTLPQLSSERVLHVSRLLYYLLNSLVSGSRELQSARSKRLLLQSRVSESIHRYKRQEHETEAYPLDKERRLLAEVRAGDVEKARAAFHELMANLYISERYDTEALKLRLTELCALLARASIERGADTDALLGLHKKLAGEIAASGSVDESVFLVDENLEIFTESQPYASHENDRLVRRATEYIGKHFSEKLTLADTARYLGVSAPYLSARFKRVTGLAFTDYLLRVRMEEARSLLRGTEFPIMDIAVACGFGDQSYFTRVFKRYTGLSPRKYR